MPNQNQKLKKEVKEFLSESNAIENVFDEDSFEQALAAWNYLVTKKKLTKHVVLKTHKLLMLHYGFSSDQNLTPDQVGYFRRVPIWVGGREGYNWREINDAIESWIVLMNAKLELNATHDSPDTLSKNLHVMYEKIHPFADGNGRTGRMFMNWFRLKHGLPLLIIHTGEEQYKYYKWFR